MAAVINQTTIIKRGRMFMAGGTTSIKAAAAGAGHG